jgi:hypothetical protein
MAEVKQSYIVRFQSEGGKVVSAEIQRMAGDGEKNLKRLGDASTGVDARMSLLTRTILTRVVPAITTAGLARAIRSTVKDLGDLKDAAEKVQISAEKLQVFRIIGEDAGINAGEVDDALGNFVKRVGEAQEGVGKLLPVLRHYKIGLTDANGENRSWEEILRDISVVIANTDDSQEQLFIAGKAGMEGMLNALRKGPEYLDNIGKSSIENGEIISEYLVNRADEFDKKWQQSMRSFSVGWKSVLLNAMQDWKDLFGAVGFSLGLNDNPFKDIGRIDDQIAKLEARKSGYMYNNLPGWRSGTDKALEEMRAKRETLANDPENIFKASIESIRKQHEAENLLLAGLKHQGSGKLSDSNNTASELEQQRKKTDDAIKALFAKNLQLEISSTYEAQLSDALGKSNKELELNNQLHQAGVTLQSEEGQKIAKMVDHWHDLTEAQRKNREEVARLVQAADSIGDAFGSAFEKAAFEADSFGEIINGLLNDIARSLFRSEISGPISTEISDFIKGFFGNAPLRDSGGPVTGGKPYRVGVPELFIPSNTGQAIPLHNLSNGGYGQVIINNYGAPEKVQVKETKRGGTTTLEVMIDQAVAQNINRGGTATNRALRQFGQTPRF